MRISNFLLWQISYAEIWVTEKCWPEFDEATLHEAIRAYAVAQAALRRIGRRDTQPVLRSNGLVRSICFAIFS